MKNITKKGALLILALLLIANLGVIYVASSLPYYPELAISIGLFSFIGAIATIIAYGKQK